MKRFAIGIVLGMLLVPSAPMASSEQETLSLLCKRFETTAGRRLNVTMKHWGAGNRAGEGDRAVATVFLELREMFCVK